jgi:hypothetical protein
LVANVRVGKRAVSPALPSHVAGVHQGNHPGALGKRSTLQPKDGGATTGPGRSTGINAKGRLPIDPRMPVLSPP